ncbi:hypothetical protein [Spirosoma aerophilum]
MKESADQYFLRFYCVVYNRMSFAERTASSGRRVYAKMKKLNEKVLAHG